MFGFPKAAEWGRHTDRLDRFADDGIRVRKQFLKKVSDPPDSHDPRDPHDSHDQTQCPSIGALILLWVRKKGSGGEGLGCAGAARRRGVAPDPRKPHPVIFYWESNLQINK